MDAGDELVHIHEFLILVHGHYTNHVFKSTVVSTYGSIHADRAGNAKNGSQPLALWSISGDDGGHVG